MFVGGNILSKQSPWAVFIFFFEMSILMYVNGQRSCFNYSELYLAVWHSGLVTVDIWVCLCHICLFTVCSGLI